MIIKIKVNCVFIFYTNQLKVKSQSQKNQMFLQSTQRFVRSFNINSHHL